MRFVFSVLLLSACSSGSGKFPPLATEGCLLGWWHGPSSSCDLACPGPPECASSDCELVDYLGFAAAKVKLSGNVTLSRMQKSFSSFGPRDQDVFSLDNAGMLTLRPGGNAIEARCQENRLDLGLATQDRYDAAVSSALDRLRGTAAFRAESF